METGPAPVAPLDLTADPVALTIALVDIPSESFAEGPLAAAVEEALRRQCPAGVEILRDGDRVLARTDRGLPTRVVLAGHLDTVPIAGNVPHRMILGPDGDERIHGCGSVDMKSGDAVLLHLFVTLAAAPALAHDLTLVMYDREEVAAVHNGLGVIERERPEWLRGDLAVLGEPTGGLVEAGCQGTVRIRVTASGTRAHSARSWLGENAIHRLGGVLARLGSYEPRRVTIDGCEYREGLQAVAVSGGVAGNVVPDAASLEVNFRFAPDRDVDAAIAHVVEVLALAGTPGLAHEVVDRAPGALPGLGRPAAAALVEAAGGVRAKYGWTDVSRFAALGVAAVNLGPGDPGYAHKRDEQCPVEQIHAVTAILRRYLTTPGAGSRQHVPAGSDHETRELR